jgi:hypothetical protein
MASRDISKEKIEHITVLLRWMEIEWPQAGLSLLVNKVSQISSPFSHLKSVINQ